MTQLSAGLVTAALFYCVSIIIMPAPLSQQK